MLEVSVSIAAPELSGAVNNLAAALTGSKPAPPAPPAPPAAPTAPPPTYTLEQIMVAGQPLLDMGKGSELIALINQFGVDSIQKLTPDQIGPFVIGLRQLGADI